jgi:hypothetical protein
MESITLIDPGCGSFECYHRAQRLFCKRSLGREKHDPNDPVVLHTIACSGLPCVRTELSNLLVVPSLAPHPEHLDR